MEFEGSVKYHLITYGCQMNEYDSEVIAGLLESAGAEPAEMEESADIIVLNTCCVRKKADDKVYGKLGQFKLMKRERPDLVIAVMGCLAQKDGESLKRRFPQVDLVIGTYNTGDLNSLVEMAGRGQRIVNVDQDCYKFLNPAVRKNPLTGFIPVSVGCDCFCSYCIVPHVRGRLISRPMDEILTEAERLVSQGIREIFLLGQNVNTYGQDLPERPTFPQLMEKVDGIKGVERLRFTSPHPKDFSPQLISAVGRLKSVCESVHLPLQSGCDRTLRAMNRKYDTSRFYGIVEDLRRTVPGVSISTDIIVGFPGETAGDFEESLAFIEKVRFDQAFMFAYSPRTGTPAERMTEQVEQGEKMERLYRLIRTQNDISREINRNLVGRIEECMVEGASRKDQGMLTGRTRGNRVVNFPDDGSKIGDLADVRLIGAYTWGFMGERA